MANYYTELSFVYDFPSELTDARRDELVAKLKKFTEDYNDEFDNDCFLSGDEVKETHFWIHGDESPDIEWVTLLIGELLDFFEDDTPQILEWANTCSKPRADGFSGAAALIRRGKETVWCHPALVLEDLAKPDSPESLQEAYGDAGHPEITVAMWREAVQKQDTFLGYFAWLSKRIKARCAPGEADV